MKPFLTAEWRKLILLTYSVDPSMLEGYLPDGLSLDLYKGRSFVSFVAFDFLHTKVKGIPVPFHINFPEINLRFYVCHTAKDGTIRRGVVFIKELVPKFFIALVANKIYNEPYEIADMQSSTVYSEGEFTVEHRVKYKGKEHYFKFFADNKPYLTTDDSTEHFFKEHEWGFGLNHSGQLMEYKVEHPHWEIYPLRKRFQLDVDFGSLYGEQWSCLNTQIPFNILLAEGSPIKVFPGKLTET